MIRPRVLAISGVDPCGGAGLGADVRAIHVCGGMPATVPSCATVQSRFGFQAAHPTPPALLRAMLDAVAADGPIQAVKLGLCADAGTVEVVAGWHVALGVSAPPMVVDPVLSATAGGGPERAEEVARAIVAELAPRGIVPTPNLPELERLGGAQALLEAGCAAVAATGGHGDGDEVVDRLVFADRTVEIRRPRIARGEVHGTGCAFSAVLATGLAQGLSLEAAFDDAVGRVRAWILATSDGRPGPAPLAIG